MSETAEEAGLATQEHNLPATEADLGTGYEGVNSSIFVMPRMRIVQPTSKEGEAGTFILNLSGEGFLSLHVMPIKPVAGRVYWEKGKNDMPVCRSLDGLVPDPKVENPPSTECIRIVPVTPHRDAAKAICPLAEWGENREAPECSEVYNLLCFELDEGFPFWLQLGGTSVKPFKLFLSAMNFRKRPPWHFHTTLTLTEKEGDLGKYYVFAYSPPKVLDQDQRAELIELVEAYRHETAQGLNVDDLIDKEAAGAGEAGQGAQGDPSWLEDQPQEAPKAKG